MKRLLPFALALCAAGSAMAADAGLIHGTANLVTVEFTPVDNWGRLDPSHDRVITYPTENTAAFGTIMTGDLYLRTPGGQRVDIRCVGAMTSMTNAKTYLVKELVTRSDVFGDPANFQYFEGSSGIYNIGSLPVDSYSYSLNCNATDRDDPNKYHIFTAIANYRINKTK